MKNLIQLPAVVYSVLATLCLALGLTQAAVKFDPVTQKAQSLSTLEMGDVAGLPCVPCGVSSDDDTRASSA